MIAFVLESNDRCGDILNLGYSSWGDLTLFHKNLEYYQSLCLVCGENTEKFKIKNDDLTTVKRVTDSTQEEFSVFYYENCFFDFSVNQIINEHKHSNRSISAFYNGDKLIFSLVSNERLRQIFLSDFSFYSIEELIKNYTQQFKTDFYFKFIDTYNSLKSLNFDILNNKTNVKLPEIAKGVFTDGKLPKGDYTIIPPVYISEKSQIENGCIVGPSSVILSNSLVACDSNISKSIICENTFISNDCLIENSICGKNTSVKRGAAVLSDSVLGYDSVLGDELYIENGAVILPGTKALILPDGVIKSLDYNIDTGCFKNLDVLSACKLGFVFGKVFNSPSVCVGNDNNLNSSAVKLAFLSGLCSSGCDCFDIGSSFLNKLFYTTSFCELQYSFFFVSDEKGVKLEAYNKNFEELKNSDLFNLIHNFKSFKPDNISFENVKKIKQINGIGKLYIRDLKNLLPEKLSKHYTVICNNNSIRKVIENIFKIKPKTCEKTSEINFFVDDSGVNLECFFGNKRYKKDVLFNVVEKLKNDVFYDNSIEFLYKKDAVVLLFLIIAFLEKAEGNEMLFINFLEKLTVIKKEFSYKNRTGKLLSRLIFNENAEYKNGKLYIINKNENIAFNLNPREKKLRLTAKCFNAEASDEITKGLDALLGDINKL